MIDWRRSWLTLDPTAGQINEVHDFLDVFEVVTVDLLDPISLLFCDTDVVLDHQLGEAATVDKNYLLCNPAA